MATYAGYRHIELDRVGCSKKRVRNPPSDIFNVMCTPPSSNGLNGSFTPRRSHDNSHDNSFKRLFGTPDMTPIRKSSLTKTDSANRNPVTGDGVVSWDCRPEKRSSRIYTERNPVTGEFYTIVSPSSTPTKIITNGVTLHNGNSTPIAPIKKEVQAVITNGNATNGEA
ncbi:hypothetical protein QE152_g12867 [Popillia japonica]|uniref:Microtubule-associated protein Jupiter n=2 Tax=Scarabaeidae TaxID=7055 RepID=A0AAW1LGI6_POPJA